MKKSLESFMSGIVDYAGLFPPSKLDMEPAIRNFAKYRQSGDRAMLSCFVIPAGRLTELEPFQELFDERPPFRFSVLSGSHESEQVYFESLERDLGLIKSFYKKFGNRVRVDALEIRIPLVDDLRDLLDRTARNINAYLPNDVSVFYEHKMEENWRDAVDRVTRTLAEHNEKMSGGVRYLQGGYKIRTGGVEAHMFPSTEQVAAVIAACLKNGLRFKATAGLHHPVRHFSDEVNTTMHGFFNVFGAAVLAKTYNLDEKAIHEIITDESSGNFDFDDSYFSWKNMKATIEGIEDARGQFSTSFGSCSFNEPLEDLQALGLR